ncbi:ATP-binding protein [Streptomyces sp. NPDC002033]|uniref:ATP-binding protein n=1 Tax=unclassified Streptomyces TaxID=2593676 RepID=UPI0033243A9E
MGATVTPSWAYTLHLPHDPRAAGIARCTLRAVLRRHDMTGLADTAELLASELVSNSYRHTRGPCALRLRAMAAGRLRVGVWDTSPDIPSPFGPEPAEDAEAGRGLVLVRLCADRYGAYRLDGAHAGKLLWVECTPPGP